MFLTIQLLPVAATGIKSAPLLRPPAELTPAPPRDTIHLSPPGPIPASIFDGLPSARTVEESKALLPARQQAVIRRWAAEPLPDWQGWSHEPGKPWKREPGGTASSTIPTRAHAKLELGLEGPRINQVLRSGTPFSGVGTHFRFLPYVEKQGDYDFSLLYMTALAYKQWHSPLLAPATKQHIARILLNQEGAGHIKPKWLLGLIPETENHILMTETARYLKNQLVQRHGLSYSTRQLPPAQYDNRLNGFNDWFINHLSQFVRQDFDEYNSKPYQAYALNAIQNLYEFAADSQVKTSARIVLDYLAARFATQSHELRRSVPFRRRQNYLGDNLLEKDSQSARYALLAGNFSPQDAASLPQGHMIQPALLSYRVPDAILDLLIQKGHNPYFMRARHRNTEIVYAEENFALSAGGHAHRWSPLPFTSQENGTPMPTVLMLKGGGPNLSQMIRFQGRGDQDKINNTGVYENFACGIRPEIPAELLAGALVKGPWKFIAAGDAYIALHTQSQASPGNYAPAVGFLEVVNKKEFPSLEAFAAQIENLNSRPFQYYGRNRYTTTRGRMIEFAMAEPLRKGKPPVAEASPQWLIKRVWQGNQEIPIETDLAKWPLADSATRDKEQDGENNDFVIKADGTGQVLINNPSRDKSLLMSLADPHQPIRIEQAGEAVNLAPKARLSSASLPRGIQLTVDLPSAQPVRYLSLKWQKGSRPQTLQVYIQEAGQWKLAENRASVFTSRDHDFRSDIDLALSPRVQRIAFAVSGEQLNLAGAPEVYLAH